MSTFADFGVFIYPLLLCSFVALTIVVERLVALRRSKVCSVSDGVLLLNGGLSKIEASQGSVVGRIASVAADPSMSSEKLEAYTHYEISQMERGLFLLEAVVGVAPLIGLLGTVTGLTEVFGGFSPESGLSDSASVVSGIALALNTTILGLAIAIPSLVAHAYFVRRIDAYAAEIELGIRGHSTAS